MKRPRPAHGAPGGAAEGDEERARLGLCATCAHGRRIRSARGSVFLLCSLSASDPAFARYPPLPVRTCSGFSAG